MTHTEGLTEGVDESETMMVGVTRSDGGRLMCMVHVVNTVCIVCTM